MASFHSISRRHGQCTGSINAHVLNKWCRVPWRKHAPNSKVRLTTRVYSSVYGYHILETRVKNPQHAMIMAIHGSVSAFDPSKEDCIYKLRWTSTLLLCHQQYYQQSEQVLDFAAWCECQHTNWFAIWKVGQDGEKSLQPETISDIADVQIQHTHKGRYLSKVSTKILLINTSPLISVYWVTIPFIEFNYFILAMKICKSLYDLHMCEDTLHFILGNNYCL